MHVGKQRALSSKVQKTKEVGPPCEEVGLKKLSGCPFCSKNKKRAGDLKYNSPCRDGGFMLNAAEPPERYSLLYPAMLKGTSLIASDRRN